MHLARRASSATLALPLLALTLILAFLQVPAAHATTPTTTTLTVTSACLTQGCAVTLSAKVLAGSASVHPGLIYFCDGTNPCINGVPLGQAQITAAGRASIVRNLSPGAHEIYAIFVGTTNYAGSTSSIQSLTIAPPTVFGTTTAIIPPTGASSNGTYPVEALVTSLGGPAGPSGATSFYDASYGSALLATAHGFGGGDTQFEDVLGTLDLSRIPDSTLQDIVKVTTGDFNGDGFNDIVLLGAHSFHVLLGTSAGSFTLAPSSAPSLGNAPGNILVGDFNSDGKLDLAVPDAASHSIHVSLGNGDGTFTDVAPTTLTNAPVALYSGDFNSDGIPDLAITTQNASSTYAVQIALGSGTGTFTLGASYLSGNVGSAPILVADEDSDGKLDLTVADSGTYLSQFQVLHGNGDGTFTPLTKVTRNVSDSPVQMIASGDFNGDGILDFFSYDGSSLDIWWGVGDGTFAPPSNGASNIYYYTLKISSITAGDFDHDGRTDLLVIAADTGETPLQSELFVYPNQSSLNYSQFVAYDGVPIPDITNGVSTPAFLAAADFNADGIPDFIDFTPALSPYTTNYAGYNVFVGALTTNIVLSPAGTHQVFAIYQGDSTHSGSTSQQVAFLGSGNYQVYDPGGFTNPSAVALNGGATIQNGVLELTDGHSFEARSAFNPNRVPVYDFDTTFTFQIPETESDGLAFVIQSNGPNAIGSNGGALGYGTPPGATTGPSIINSMALVFDTHNNQGEGANTIRIERGGITSPAGSVSPAFTGIDLRSGDHFQAEVTYNETSNLLVLKLADLDMGHKYTWSFQEDLVKDIGGTSGYVGFTAGTGATASTVKISSWDFAGTRCCDSITPGLTPYLPTGFTGANSSLNLYNGATVSGSVLQLTNGTPFEATSAYFNGTSDMPIWSTDFDFTITPGTGGDGFTFFRSSGSKGAIGGTGGALGYAGPYLPTYQSAPLGFSQGFAIKFDVHNNAGEGPNSTGIYVNGAFPSTPANNLFPSQIDLSSGHTFHARISHFENTVHLSITDLNEYAAFSTSYPLPYISNTANIGFTAATGATSNTIKILNWTFDDLDVDKTN